MPDCCYEQLQKILEDGNERFLPISRKTNVVSTATYSPTAAIVDTYIGGLDSSDELCEGRGMVPELPFSTFNALASYIRTNIVANSVNVNLVGNVTQAQPFTSQFNDIPWNIVGNSKSISIPSMVFANRCYISDCSFNLTDTVLNRALLRSSNGGSLFLKNVTATSNAYTVGCASISSLWLMNCKLSATGTNAAVIYADSGSFVCIYSGIVVSGSGLANVILSTGSYLVYSAQDSTLMKGSFTGKKYHLTRGSFLVTRGNQSSVPGTLAGTIGEGCHAL